MSGAAAAVKVATGELGTHEKPGNHVKYNDWLGPIGGTTGYAWCCSFQSWVDWKAGNGAYAPKTAGCLVAVAWFKQRGRFHNTPAIGAWVFYGPSGGTHVERVISYTATTITTIGGNTSGSYGGRYFDGDAVARKSIARSASRIYGYGWPAYPAATSGATGAGAQEDDVPDYVSLSTKAPIKGTKGQKVAVTWDKVYDGTHKDGIIPAAPARGIVEVASSVPHQLYAKGSDGKERDLGGGAVSVVALYKGDVLYCRLLFDRAAEVTPYVKAAFWKVA